MFPPSGKNDCDELWKKIRLVYPRKDVIKSRISSKKFSIGFIVKIKFNKYGKF